MVLIHWIVVRDDQVGALMMTASTFFLVCKFVFKVLSMPKQECVVVVPESVEDPEPHDTTKTLSQDLVPI